MAEINYYIQGINGPVVTVKGGKGLAMMDMVSVGPEGLIGEVVSVKGDETTVQVYEDTTGLIPGMPVIPQGAPMSIALGPGLLSNIFDGICRPHRRVHRAWHSYSRAGYEKAVGRDHSRKARRSPRPWSGVCRVR